MLPGPWTNVHHVISRVDGFLVVFHHNEGVTNVPELFQRFDESGVIPLMETDAGFVQDVEHTHQSRPDLGGQTDTLGFATR